MNKKKKKLLIQNFLQANTIFLKWSLFIIKVINKKEKKSMGQGVKR